MKSKSLLVFLPLAAALLLAVPSAEAKVYTPTQFRLELAKKIGTRKGIQASIQVAALLNVALSDKRNKKNILSYTTSVNAAVKKAVPASLAGDAANRLVRSLTTGYFTGIKFNLNDLKYTTALKKLLNALPSSQRTQPVSYHIYVTIRTLAARYRVSRSAAYAYYLKVKPGNYPTPVS